MSGALKRTRTNRTQFAELSMAGATDQGQPGHLDHRHGYRWAGMCAVKATCRDSRCACAFDVVVVFVRVLVSYRWAQGGMLPY